MFTENKVWSHALIVYTPADINHNHQKFWKTSKNILLTFSDCCDNWNLLYVNRVLITYSITGWYHVTVVAVVSWETWVAQLTQWLNYHCLPLHFIQRNNQNVLKMSDFKGNKVLCMHVCLCASICVHVCKSVCVCGGGVHACVCVWGVGVCVCKMKTKICLLHQMLSTVTSWLGLTVQHHTTFRGCHILCWWNKPIVSAIIVMKFLPNTSKLSKRGQDFYLCNLEILWFMKWVIVIDNDWTRSTTLWRSVQHSEATHA